MRDLKQRFGSLDALDAPDLWTEAELRSSGSVTSPPERPGRRWLAVAVAFAVAFAGIGLAVWAFRAPSSRPTPAASPVENGLLAFSLGTAIDTVGPDGTGLTSLRTEALVAAYGPVWSPDGARIAFYGYPRVSGTCGGGSNYDVYVMNADGSDVQNLTTSPSDVQACFSQTAPRWSPDGSMLAYDGDDGLYVMNADGSGQRKLLEDGMTGFAWSPDGSGCAYVDRGGLYTTTLSGASPVPLVTGDGSVDSPAWSPDGTLIAFLHSGGVDGKALSVVPAGGGETIQVADLSKLDTVGTPVWSPDSRELAFDAFDGTSWDIWIASADLAGATDATDITSDPTTDENAPAWAPDGTRIAFERSTVLSTSTDNAGTFDIWTMNPDGTDRVQVTHGVRAMGFDVAWQAVRAPAPSGTSAPTPTAPTPEPTPSPASAGGHIGTTIDVGDAGSVAFGEGSVWVAQREASSYGGFILRIDSVTNEVVATILVDAVPQWETGGGGLTVANGSVWVAGPIETAGGGSEAAVVQIDPATNTVIDTVRLGGLSAQDVSVSADGSIWVLMRTDADNPEVVKLDPTTHRVVASLPSGLHGNYGRRIFATDVGSLVDLTEPPNGTIDSTQVVAISASTDPQLWIPWARQLPYSATAEGDGQLWAGTGRTLEQIDPATGKTIGVPAAVSNTGDVLAVGNGRVWFLDPENRGILHGYDPATGTVDVNVDLGKASSPIAIATSSGSVWVLDYHGTLTRVDLD